MIIAAAVAVLKIRFNAVLTGVFLAIELAALLILTVLGFSHARNWSALAHPVIGGAHVLEFCSVLGHPRSYRGSGLLRQRIRQRGELL